MISKKKTTQPTAEQPPSSERRNSRGGLSVKVGILRATGIASDDKVIILALSSLELIGFRPEVSLLDCLTNFNQILRQFRKNRAIYFEHIPHL